ncbi:proteobacterial dedicated sortase system histidine kinase [Candidatus Albibeggiatoa sp. nov. NOAA]|uniref:proteobacterial dedicated sortase system histidine kinase n=1 Tax=Candidatus Albibeggiatoa sp. nov. NOAA TaxID=3162724 RepID=UPI003302C182|nr:proteobacterial dedicated sortase system histidine kinase [Thiotrichaceae bacterium]
MSLTIRSKVLLLSLTLFSIPYVGYEYVLEMEKYLRDNLETSLKDASHSLASVLHNQPELFNRQLSDVVEFYKPLDNLRQFRVGFHLDGNTNDWEDYLFEAQSYAEKHTLYSSHESTAESLSFQHVVGTYRNYLYNLFIVKDEAIVYRNQGDLSIKRSDHLQVVIQDNEQHLHRYIIAPSKAGWINAYRVSAYSDTLLSDPERRIQGTWAETSDGSGYVIEVRIPMNLMGERFSFAIGDVDDKQTRQLKTLVANVGIEQSDETGHIYVESPKINQIIQALGNAPGRRVWVLDKQRRILASYGDLYRELHEHPLDEVFSLLLPPVSEKIDNSRRDDGLYYQQIQYALNGLPDVRWHSTDDDKAVIVSAAHPIRDQNQVIGAVMVEETSHSIQTVQRQAIANLFNKTLLLFTVVTLLLLVFASRLSVRLRHLRNQAETAIDANGRVTATKIGSNAKDEIGDLSRSFSNILDKLNQYNNYLEGMASRLSHELRTPIAVVRSSLENLELEQDLSEHSTVYIERAKQGIERLNTTITRLSEATRLEQALQDAEREKVDLKDLVSNCVAGYRLAYPEQRFHSVLPNQPIVSLVAPDLIAQMLDKLVSNAADFSDAEQAIRVELVQERGVARLSVLNRGANIPADMQERLFESMVSFRQSTDAREPHLGLGLYMVRLIVNYHGGLVKVSNHPEGSGAMFTVWLPMNGQITN